MVNLIESDLISVAEAASLLKVDRSTIRRWITAGSLPAYKVGQRSVRIRRNDLGNVVKRADRHQSGSDSLGDGIRVATSIADVRPLTREEQLRTLVALENLRTMRKELRKKYGVFEPSALARLVEARRIRDQQLS